MTDTEFDWIRDLAGMFASGASPDGSVGIGDDAAILPIGGGRCLAVSIDAQVEDIHFRREWLSWVDLGWRLLQVGFSDIAACGARPIAAVVSVEVGPDVTAEDRHQFSLGIAEACSSLGARLVGGNVAGRASGFSAHVCALGETRRDQVILRKGARVNDAIFVTGPLGGAALARHLLDRGNQVDAEGAILSNYRRPRAHWREGLVLAESGLIHAMIDVSDGLSADLNHLCEASGVGAEVDAERIPSSHTSRKTSRTIGLDPIELALGGGEDYVLLFSASSDSEESLRKKLEPVGGAIFRIGMVTDQAGMRIRRDGVISRLPSQGFDHFTG